MATTNGMDEKRHAALVRQCDALIKELGYENKHSCQLCEQADKFGSELVSHRQNASETVSNEAGKPLPEEFDALLQQAASASVHCAQLLEKALQIGGKFNKTHQQLLQALQGGADQQEDHDEPMKEQLVGTTEDEEEDEEATLLLSDLVVAAEQMDKANRQLNQLGIVRKSLQVSRKLLESAEDALTLPQQEEAHGASQVDRKAFGDLYMEEFTNAFGDELDQFRQEDSFESKDVSFLIASIHAGADLFTPLQKRLLSSSSRSSSLST